MRRLAKAKGCQPHVYPLRVVFVPEDFSQANGLRNANFKLLWTKVEERFTELIMDAYKEPLTPEEKHHLDSGGH